MLQQVDLVAEAFSRAAQLLDPIPSVYYNDPVAWVDAFIKFPPDQELTPYQREVMAALPHHKRVSVRGPHGLGKTAMEALIILWFAETRESAGQDWKIPTTASVWRQLDKFLWPEIHKWARRMDWDKLGGRPWRPGKELLDLNIKLSLGSAFALASDDPTALEGAHADHILYIFDEAKAIIAGTFEAAEGAFSGAGEGTGLNAFALVCSTPGEPSGTFADIQLQRPGTEDWWVRHVTKEEAIAAGRISIEWVEQRGKQWGTESSIYKNRVEGQFADQSEDAVIPLKWVEAAIERWEDLMALPEEERVITPLSCLGVDVARSGEDWTVMAERHANVVTEVHRYALQSTMATANIAHQHLNKNPKANRPKAAVDVIGVGAGVVDRLRELGDRVEPFNGAEGTVLTDVSGELEFLNRRAAAWWTMRELLDPQYEMNVCLPNDDLLVGDLVAPKFEFTAAGRLKIEEKREVKKRIGRSPDTGDAVVQAFCPAEPKTIQGMVVYDQPVSISPV